MSPLSPVWWLSLPLAFLPCSFAVVWWPSHARLHVCCVPLLTRVGPGRATKCPPGHGAAVRQLRHACCVPALYQWCQVIAWAVLSPAVLRAAKQL